MEDEFFEDLLTAGHEVMERNPGIDFDKWVDILMYQYPTEVVDAVGSHPAEAYDSLEEIWESHFKGSYNDENTPDNKSIAGVF